MDETTIKACRSCLHYAVDAGFPCCTKYPVHHVDYLNGEEHFTPRICQYAREAHGLRGPDGAGFELAPQEQLQARLQNKKNWFIRILEQL